MHLKYSQNTIIVVVNKLNFASVRFIKSFALKVIVIIWSSANDATTTMEQLPSTNNNICVCCKLINPVHDVDQSAKNKTACQRFNNPNVHACKMQVSQHHIIWRWQAVQSLWLDPTLESVTRNLYKTPKHKQYSGTRKRKKAGFGKILGIIDFFSTILRYIL